MSTTGCADRRATSFSERDRSFTRPLSCNAVASDRIHSTRAGQSGLSSGSLTVSAIPVKRWRAHFDGLGSYDYKCFRQIP
jgi:hypothetical protein